MYKSECPNCNIKWTKNGKMDHFLSYIFVCKQDLGCGTLKWEMGHVMGADFMVTKTNETVVY